MTPVAFPFAAILEPCTFEIQPVELEAMCVAKQQYKAIENPPMHFFFLNIHQDDQDVLAIML